MTKKTKIYTATAIISLLLLVGLILAVFFVDVKPIGPNGSEIGLSSINGAVRDSIGKNDVFYIITEVFGIIALMSVVGFAFLGLYQLIKRKSLSQVDFDIYAIAGLYAAVAAVYVFFEVFIVNYRPLLEDGVLKASFPSSHTMIVMCFMSAAYHQLKKRITNKGLRNVALALCALFILLTPIGRLMSGVHWFTDIVGGILASTFLVSAYLLVCEITEGKLNRIQQSADRDNLARNTH